MAELHGEYWWTIRRTDGTLEMYWDGDNRLLAIYPTKEAAQARINEPVESYFHVDGSLKMGEDKQMLKARAIRILIAERPDEPGLL